MAKKRTRSSDSSSASSDDDRDDDDKSRPTPGKKVVSAKIIESSDDSSSSSDADDGEWNAKPKSKSKKAKKKAAGSNKKGSSKKKKKNSSESDLSSSSSEDEEDSKEKAKRQVKHKVKPSKRAKKYEEEMEEGEVEDGSDYDEDDMEEFNDGLDENLMGDEEDRRRLSMMTEKEREQELFNRSEKREVAKTRFVIEKKLRAAKKKQERQKQQQKEVKPSKSKKPAKESTTVNKSKVEDASDDILPTSLDSAARCYERRRNIEDKRKKDSIKVLQAEREKKKEKLKQKLRAADIYSDSSDSNSDSDSKGAKKKTTTASSSGESSSSESGSEADSDVEENKSKRKRNVDDSDWGRDSDQDDDEAKEQFVLTRQHINSIRLSRFKLEKFSFAPFFKNVVVGCFVRIGVGNLGLSHHDVAGPSYQVAQVLDIVETAKVYNIGKTRTNKGLKLKLGKYERVYRMEYVSNQEITEDEYNFWYGKMMEEKLDFPTKDLIERKQKDISDALQHNYNDREIELIVTEKEKFKSKPINFAMRKTRLMKEKEYAESTGDHERVAQLITEIEKIEDEAKTIDKLRTKNIAGISFINERNRMRNIVIEDKDLETLKEEAKQQKDDPFTRRKCMPTMVHKVNKNKGANNENGGAANNNNKNDEKDTQPSNSHGQNGEAVANGGSNGQQQSKVDALLPPGPSSLPFEPPSIGISVAKIIKPIEPKEADDLFSAHDFDINLNFDLDIDGSSAGSLSNGGGVLFSNGGSSTTTTTSKSFSDKPRSSMLNSGINRRLNLDEYKKKKGLI